jgi:hypothetical protein
MPPPRLTPLHPVPLPPMVAMKSVFEVVFEGRASPKKRPLLCWRVLNVMPDLASVYGDGAWAAAREARAPVRNVDSFMVVKMRMTRTITCSFVSSSSRCSYTCSSLSITELCCGHMNTDLNLSGPALHHLRYAILLEFHLTSGKQINRTIFESLQYIR